MTLQEVLNRNYDWFFVRKMPPGVDDMGNCIFYGPPTKEYKFSKQCAIGCLIPKNDIKIRNSAKKSSGDIYDAIAGTGHFAKWLKKQFKNKKKNTNRYVIKALSELQSSHDESVMDEEGMIVNDSEFRKSYESELRKWAKNYNLKWPKSNKSNRKGA